MPSSWATAAISGLGGVVDGELLDAVAHRHHREEADPAAVAGAVAAGAADGLVGLDVGADAEAGLVQRLLGEDRALLAVLAELARQALGDDGLDRGADQEALDAHLREAGDRARRAVGVQRREDHVAGERGLDRDPRRLGVADLADHDDVGVGAQDRAQPGGERQARPCG